MGDAGYADLFHDHVISTFIPSVAFNEPRYARTGVRRQYAGNQAVEKCARCIHHHQPSAGALLSTSRRRFSSGKCRLPMEAAGARHPPALPPSRSGFWHRPSRDKPAGLRKCVPAARPAVRPSDQCRGVCMRGVAVFNRVKNLSETWGCLDHRDQLAGPCRPRLVTVPGGPAATGKVEAQLDKLRFMPPSKHCYPVQPPGHDVTHSHTHSHSGNLSPEVPTRSAPG